jgi:hypothetical protein
MSRIASLPRRDWKADAAPFVERLSAILKTPGGSQKLRLAQTGALLELAAARAAAARRRGLFINGRVGIGKTLALALAARVVGAQRPLIVTLGGILKETKGHVDKTRSDWQVPVDIVFTSYTALGNLPRKGLDLRSFWHGLDPDFVGCDEVDKLANMSAACSQMVAEWRDRCPDAWFMPVTATCDVEGLPSYAHTMAWALGEESPLPLDRQDIEAWAEVIDRGNMLHAAGVCVDLGISRKSTLSQIRAAYRERLHSAPGVIIDDTPFTAVPLTFHVHALDVGLEAEFVKLRVLGQKADGVDVLPDDVIDGPEQDDGDDPDTEQPDRVANGQTAEVARQYGRGFFYKMDPPAPEPWLAARRSYLSWVRHELEARHFKTEAQARAWAEETGLARYARWAAIKDTFAPQFRTVWLTRKTLEWAAEWAKANPTGIIWTEHTAVGLELERLTGLTYYGGRGFSQSGKYIENAPTGRPIIASRRANSIGRNLQYKWNCMLFLQPLGKSRLLEQAAGRVHREGIETWSDGVRADVLLTCSEDQRAVAKTLASAERTCSSIYSQKAATCEWFHVSDTDLPQTTAFV